MIGRFHHVSCVIVLTPLVNMTEYYPQNNSMMKKEYFVNVYDGGLMFYQHAMGMLRAKDDEFKTMTPNDSTDYRFILENGVLPF